MKKYLDYCQDCQLKPGENILTQYSEKNIILYGNNYLNNYVFSLSCLKPFSKSELKYSRRIVISYNGEDILFNISDIHFEVDFDLLGVNQYNIFLTLFHHIKENLISDKQVFYVVCLNFQEIKIELMNIFYSFLNESKIRFIILTNQISFMCDKIFQSSVIKKIKGSVTHVNYGEQTQTEKVTNIITQGNVSLFQLREQLYTFLTLNYKVHDCFANIIFNLIEISYINEENINNVLKMYNEFTEKYNNNYRPIYHLESFILFLINLKNKQEHK
jgi:hypothetical protein